MFWNKKEPVYIIERIKMGLFKNLFPRIFNKFDLRIQTQKYCEKCNLWRWSDETFCPSCGDKLSHKTRKKCECGAFIYEYNYCPTCGTKNDI